jgi:hypothetical protein
MIMGFIKWIVLFLCAFCVAFVIIVTFSQAPFKQPVPAMIFTYQTASIPLYWYVLGALCLGLVIGLVVALYYGIVLKAALYKKKKRIRELEDTVGLLESAQNKNAVDPAPDAKSLSTDAV